MNCSNKQQILCGNSNCNVCFEKSFKNYNGKTINDKFKYDCIDINKHIGIDILKISKGSSKKYWFICDNCNHNFEKAIKEITRANNKGSWCSYCSIIPRLCNDLSCTQCLNKSFESFTGITKKSNLMIDCLILAKNNNISARQIVKGSETKYWFKCDECNHEFQKMISIIVKNNSWCPYCCASSSIFCNDYLNDYNNCNHCYNKSFASHPMANYFNVDKNNNANLYYIINDNKNKYWFNCNKCNHSYDAKLNNIKTGYGCPYCSNKKKCTAHCQFCINNSLASFTQTTIKGKLKIDCWITDKNNGLMPKDISKHSHKKYWFKCDECNNDFEISSNCIINNNSWCNICNINHTCFNPNCNKCKHKLFINFMGLTNTGNLIRNCIISKNVNINNLYKNSDTKLLFKCDNCNHEFNKKISIICNNSNRWCDYCSDKLICNHIECNFCYNKLFISYKGLTVKGNLKINCYDTNKNIEHNLNTIKLYTSNKYWFICDNCNHNFKSKINCITKLNTWCPYCCNNSKILCEDNECNTCFNKSLASFKGTTSNDNLILNYIDYSNTKINPRNIFLHGDTRINLICDECNNKWSTAVKKIAIGRWCLLCKNKTERKFKIWFNKSFPDLELNSQARFDWCKSITTNKHLPFDFSIPKLNLLIEIDGPQHFEQISNWQSYEERQQCDKYKLQCGLTNNWKILRIEQIIIYNNTHDWKTKTFDYINNLINYPNDNNNNIYVITNDINKYNNIMNI